MILPLPRALLLDLDDTLIDRDAALRAWLLERLQSGPFEADPAAVSDMIERLMVLDAHGYGPKRTLFQTIAEATHVTPTEVQAGFFRGLPGYCRLRPDADRLLQSFGGSVVVVTNGWSRVQRGKIVAAGLGDRVAGVVVSEEVGVEKPDPAMFGAALKLAGVAAEHALMIGDHPVNDVGGAEAAGIPAVLLRSAGFEVPAGVRSVGQLDEIQWDHTGKAG